MLNQFVLVGRLTEIKSSFEDFTIVNISVPRSFKNKDGEYENDLIDIKLTGNIAKNTLEFCKTGDLIGAKGRIESDNFMTILVAEKITFLSTKSES